MARVSFLLAILLGTVLAAMKNYLFAEILVLISVFAVGFMLVVLCLLILVVLVEVAVRNYLCIRACITKSRMQHVANSAIGKP